MYNHVLYFSRIYQVAKNYMFSPHSGLYSCPLAMTDGAAKVLQVCPRSHIELICIFNMI